MGFTSLGIDRFSNCAGEHASNPRVKHQMKNRTACRHTPPKETRSKRFVVARLRPHRKCGLSRLATLILDSRIARSSRYRTQDVTISRTLMRARRTRGAAFGYRTFDL